LGVAGNLIGQELQGYETVQPSVLGLVDNAHSPTADFLDNAVMRNGSPDHAQECYGGSVGKSMKAVELTVSQEDCWRNSAP
jgi:hypothetical protein